MIQPLIVVVMGVSGAGKTTIGRMLAARLNCSYYDADDFHPAENIEKMSRGIPLTDGDRSVWLEAIRSVIAAHLAENRRVVVSCSALKDSYRDFLGEGDERISFLYLKVPQEVVAERLRVRTGHFFDPALLQSQYETLEEPEGAVTVDASRSIPEVVEEAVNRLSGG